MTPAALETSDATLGLVIDQQQVNSLPLNGRNFMNLASLAAGIASHEPGARDSAEGGFSSNGNRSYDNNIMLDGVDDNNLMPDLRSGTDFMIEPPPDAIAEFKVETNGYAPEFGRGGGERCIQIRDESVSWRRLGLLAKQCLRCAQLF